MLREGLQEVDHESTNFKYSTMSSEELLFIEDDNGHK